MSKKTADDLLADLDSLGVEEEATPAAKNASTNKTTNDDDDDAFEEIQKQLAAKPAATSRPSTPRVSSSATSATTKRTADYTPASTSVGSSERNSSEDRARINAPQTRSSGEGTRSFHQAQTYGEDHNDADTQQQKAASGGGWWGSMFSAASAAVKQAESIAKEISSNEEAQKWADQVRGRVQNLQSFGTDLRSRALPTFTSLISHIAPPISAHERLQIHITHDIQNYPSLDPLIYSTFSRIMAQVEGGDLLVIQRGSESRNRSTSNPSGYRGGMLSSGGAWSDGPWWREETRVRSLSAVPGLPEGTRLARVSAEAYAKEFFDARGGVEEAAKKATEVLSESNPVRSSDIFLAIQAISHVPDAALFADDAHNSAAAADTTVVVDPAPAPDAQISFAVYLYDPIHSLSFHGLSQPFPQRWADWLDAPADSDALPESIVEILRDGGVDPREWVAEWIEEILSLGVAVVAQQYVAKRMGVGEGGIGRGKMRVEDEVIGGEAARVI